MADQTSVAQTGATALQITGGASVLLWSLACLKAHELLIPDNATAIVMTGMVAPYFHAFGRKIQSWLGTPDYPIPTQKGTETAS